MTGSENEAKKSRHHGEGVAEEHPAGDRGQLIFALVFFAAWILDSFLLHWTTFLNDWIPWFVRVPFAVIPFLLALYFGNNAHKVVFDVPRESPGVITTGVFARTRHPLYFGEWIFFLTFILVSLSLLTLGVWVMMGLFFNLIAGFEEMKLEEKFGEDYRSYKEQVPKWFPRLRIPKN